MEIRRAWQHPLALTPEIYRVEKMKKVPTADELKKLMKDDEIKAVRVDGVSSVTVI